MESLIAYIPMDRRQAMARGADLPEKQKGTALFADISGFTPLTEALANEFGPQRGAEELTCHLNLVYDALIAEVDRYRGSVVSFSGDAITCWFDAGDLEVLPASKQAVACALAMQQVIGQLASVTIPSGLTFPLAMKAAVASGTARRFLVGDPQVQVIDTLAGAILDSLAQAEHHAGKGEVLIDAGTAGILKDLAEIGEWRELEDGQVFGVVSGLHGEVEPAPWPKLTSKAISATQARMWLLPAVYERLSSGQGEFLAELRPAVSFFLRFTGIDFEGDPSAGEKLDAYVRQAQRVVSEYEAVLIQLTIGDKGSYLQAAFGAPVAHEDDAARALSAAMALRTPQLAFIDQVQIGISKGRMRSGAYGSLTRRTYGMMGDDVNLAARLMQAARTGQILVNQSVCQGIESQYQWEQLPALRVKGKAEPVKVYGLIGRKERSASRMLDSRYALPMVGRQAELADIQERIGAALQGRGQQVGIAGEAGVGKSRLVAQAIQVARQNGMLIYQGECQSYGTHTSYLVWQGIWRDFFGLNPADPVETQLEKMEKRLAAIDPTLVARLPLLGVVLNLPIPDNELTRAFDAKLRKASLEALLVACLRAQGLETPSFLVLEDCQWIDPLSHDLLEVIGRAIANLKVFILMAYRPPLSENLPAPRISRLPTFHEIHLEEFSPQEAEQLISLKLGQLYPSVGEIPSGLVRLVTERAQGNPFFIEELLNYLMDRGGELPDLQALHSLDLPTSLHSLILSRIDRLSESQKITLKVASVIGRLFRVAMLWGCYPQIGDSQVVIADLKNLIRLELVELDTPEPELTYLFKHILTQEVAYESLPFATRAMLHDQIGQYIERAYAGHLDQFIDLLAYHYDRTLNQAKRREYLAKAGEAAQRNYANSAAIDYFQRLLPLLRPDEKIQALLKLGKVHELTGRWSEAERQYQQALNLADQLSDRLGRAWVQTAQGELMRKQGSYARAAAWLEQALYAFEDLGDKAGVGQALHYAGTLAAQQGNYDDARQLYEQSLAIRRELGDKPQIASLLNNLGILARFRGDEAASLALPEEALTLRRELGDKWAIANSLNNLGVIFEDQNNLDEARARLEEALALLREIGDPWAIANALNNLGNVARTQGDYPKARSLYHESMIIYQEYGDKRALAYLLEDIGCMAALQGQIERALCLIGSASALRQEIGSPLSSTELKNIDRKLAMSARQLSECEQAQAYGKGRSMSLDEATQFALQENQS